MKFAQIQQEIHKVPFLVLFRNLLERLLNKLPFFQVIDFLLELGRILVKKLNQALHFLLISNTVVSQKGDQRPPVETGPVP